MLAAALVLTWALGAAGAEWELQKHADGIRVWTRPSATSSFDEYRGEMVLDQPVTVPASLAFAPKTWRHWIGRVKGAWTLAQVAPGETLTNTLVAGTWPVADRDYPTRNIISQDPETLAIVIRTVAEPDAAPKTKGAVRVRQLAGTWTFQPLGPQRTRVLWEVASQPGGDIPAVLANAVVVSQPFDTLKGLRKACRKLGPQDSLPEGFRDQAQP
jgi:hypothetical protein